MVSSRWSLVMSARSACQHKAWGGAKRNPREPHVKKYSEPAERATAVSKQDDRLHLCRPFRGLSVWFTVLNPGAYAPGLGFRLLRRLRTTRSVGTACQTLDRPRAGPSRDPGGPSQNL